MATIEFTRGDANRHKVSIPADAWSAGGKLFFAAKQVIDDDTTDAAAQIRHSWDDSYVSDVTINGSEYKQYNCYFPPSATSSIVSDGADSLELLGEFQWVPAIGDPVTFPATNDKLQVIVYFDVNRKTA